MHNPAGHKQARKPQNTQSSIQLSAKTINVKKMTANNWLDPRRFFITTPLMHIL